jgi:hypothetical protein
MLRASSAFWETFVAEHWCRSTLAIERGFTDLPLDPQALFKATLAACNRCDWGSGVRLFLGAERQDLEASHELLPRPEDGSLEGYDRRMRQGLGHEDYSLVINNLEIFSFDLWSWSRGFLRSLFSRAGMNNLGIYYALYIGKYRTTFLGIHRDPESVFHLPVIGRKRIRTWLPSYVEQHPELRSATRYEDHLDASVLLAAGPGGMLYWPAELWHVGENDENFTASLALSLLTISPTDPLFTVYLRCLYQAQGELPSSGTRFQYPFNPEDLQDTGDHPPESLLRFGRSMVGLYSEESLRRLWLRLTTGYGFFNTPRPLEDVSIDEDEMLQGDPEYPIVWAQGINGVVDVSVNGKLLQLPQNLAIGTLLSRLNSGVPVRVRELQALSGAARGSPEAQLVNNLLARVVAFQGAHKLVAADAAS